MQRIILEKICKYSIAACSSAILFLPLVVLMQTYYPYIFGKIALFRIFVEIGLMAWIPLFLLDKKYRPVWKHPFILALSAFMGVLILTMITGIDPYRSFWSSQERMTGVFTMLHFYVWFLMMISVFKTFKEWRRFIFLTIGISVIVSMYGLALQSGDRYSSTLGNPIYLGVYAMIHIFLILFLVSSGRKRKIQSFFLFCIIAFELFIMIGSGSRAAFASTLIGMSILLIPFVSLLASKKKYGILWSGTAVLAVIFSFVLFVNISSVGNAWIKKAFTYSVHRLFLFESYTNLSARGEVWRMGIEGFKERPVFGWGWENYPNIFQKYYEQPVEGEKYFDRSHNQIIDILALTGGVGFISYLAVWAALFWMVLKKLWKEKSVSVKFSCASFAALFLAYFVQNLSVFDTPAPLIMLYFSFGALYIFLYNSQDDDAQKNIYGKKEKKQKPSSLVYGAGIAGVILVSGMMYRGTLLPFAKSAQAMKGISAVVSSGMITPEGLDYFKKALEANTFINPEIRMEFARDIQQSKGAVSHEIKKEAILFAVNEMDASISEHPYEARYYFFALEMYRLAIEYDPSFIQKAEKAVEISMKLAPKRPESYRNMAQIYLQVGDIQKSVAFAQKGIDSGVSPKDMYFFLATLYLQAKDFDKAFAELDQAEKEGFTLSEKSNFPVYLVMNLPSGQENEKAVSYVDRYVIESKNDPIALGTQAVVYFKTGRKEEAQNIFARIQTLDADFANQVRQYMQ
jgi:O-antigen ligase/tetratricopeptide (TPR) repeat protein